MDFRINETANQRGWKPRLPGSEGVYVFLEFTIIREDWRDSRKGFPSSGFLVIPFSGFPVNLEATHNMLPLYRSSQADIVQRERDYSMFYWLAQRNVIVPCSHSD